MRPKPHRQQTEYRWRGFYLRDFTQKLDSIKIEPNPLMFSGHRCDCLVRKRRATTRTASSTPATCAARTQSLGTVSMFIYLETIEINNKKQNTFLNLLSLWGELGVDGSNKCSRGDTRNITDSFLNGNGSGTNEVFPKLEQNADLIRSDCTLG